LTVIGTPEYMAPEFYDNTYNEKVDIWALGLCVQEMVTLDTPYCECNNVASIYRAVSSGLKPAGILKIEDNRIVEFIACCLERNYTIRWSADQLFVHPLLGIKFEKNVYAELRPSSEVQAILQGIKDEDGKETEAGWLNYLKSICDPIREEYKQEIHQNTIAIRTKILEKEKRRNRAAELDRNLESDSDDFADEYPTSKKKLSSTPSTPSTSTPSTPTKPTPTLAKSTSSLQLSKPTTPTKSLTTLTKSTPSLPISKPTTPTTPPIDKTEIDEYSKEIDDLTEDLQKKYLNALKFGNF